MKKLYLIFPILLFFIYGSFAQTTITTNYTAGATTSLTGNPGVVFAIDNSNSHTVTITDVGHYTQAGNTANWTLWYNPTASLTGAPTSVTTANGWIEVTPTQSATNGGTAGIIPVLTGIEVDIPANTAYRFALVSSNGLYYGNASSAPNSFTDEGVSIWVGDNTNSPGYTGAFPNMTVNTPRSFYGFITFTGENDDCFSPGDLALDTLMPTTAEFSWTASPDVTGGYDWALMGPGDDPDVDTPIQSGNATGTNLLVSNLTVLTDYVFFIQTDCGADGPSVWRSVEFQTPPTCPGVDNIQVYNVTHQEAFVSWTEMGPATSWNVEYGAPGYTPGTGTTVATTNNPHNLTGLAMFTEYDLYVQSNCGPGDLSIWFGPFNFHTTIDCTAYALDISSTTGGSVCGGGSVTLGATASGTGTDIFWYDSLTSTIPIGNGTVFETPDISSTTSYWAAEVVATGVTMPGVGQVVPSQSISTTTNGGLIFNTTQNFTLVDVEVFGTSATGGQLNVELRDLNNSNATVASATATIPGGGSSASPVPVTVPLNFNVPPGDYRLVKTTSGPTFIYNSGTFPHPIGNFGTITGGATLTGTSTLYYIFYNWTISTGEVECESFREEVVATVNNSGDEDVLSLPYTHTANTATYFNNYSGAPGTDCGSSDAYLDGYDVVYKYTADDDYILTVELSGLTEPNTAVFVYESCADIGTACYSEGSVNGNIGTHSFQVAVEDTKDYYFVVSSADPTVSFNYTLTINGTTCSNFPAPIGPANQNFIAGQTLADLDVVGSELTWYSDVALATVIPDDTQLANTTTYYVTQSFQGCEGAALAITVTEVACTSLEVLTTTPGTVCGEGSVILEAQGAEPSAGTEIHWFDAATGGNMVGKGSTFRTPEINQTTSFWASEVAMSGGDVPGQAKTQPTLTTTSTLSNYGLQFNVTTPFTLVDVEVYPTTGGTMDLELRDASGTVLESIAGINVPAGNGTDPVTVTLNMDIPAGNGLRLIKTSSSPTMIRESSGNVYPYPIGTVGEILGGALNQGSALAAYYWFYNWTITEAVALCESPREEVIATVNDVADELVTEPLPFVHTANTSAYGNNYGGEPGGDCNDGTPYLDGNDVVYQYSPTVGGVYKIELSGLSSNNAAVFVYGSCYDIGSSCYAGAVNDGTTGNISIDEVPMFDGFDYFIVISTSDSPSTDYTLTIDLANINCVDYTTAPGGDANQFFETGDTLADLVVHGGNLTWYSDAAGTTTIPESTLLIDGDTYYVQQTLNGCDSDLLAITVAKIDCSALEILSTTDGNIVCKGVAQLEAVGNGGLGTEIFWYDAPSGGDRVGVGPSFITPELTNTTSYWATEVFLEGDTFSDGYGLPAPISGANFGSAANYGLLFDVHQTFTLYSVDVYTSSATGDQIEITIFDEALNSLFVMTESVPPGNGTTPYTVVIDYEFQPGNNYRLSRTSTGGNYKFENSNAATIGYPFIVDGGVATIKSGAYGTNIPPGGGNHLYYIFYNWAVGSSSVLCESPREEVTATVTQDGDIIVPPTLPYIDANNSTSNYGNPFSGVPGTTCGTTENYLNGNDVVYMYTATQNELVDITLKDISGFYAGLFVYESCGYIGTDCVAGAVAGATEDDVAIKEFDMVSGQTYYIVVSSWLTQSIGYTLEIKGFDCATFPAPIGDANQDFAAPATLADLDVEGTMSTSVLNWYSDAAGTLSIPDTTTLVDATTYYVSQSFGTCEGPLLAITVTEIDCSDLEIISTTGATVACKGVMTLSATASGTGSEIYWYDAATGGDRVGMGPTFTTKELTTTTSYWASEVLIEGQAPLGGQGYVYPSTISSGSNNNQGVLFSLTEQIELVDVEVFSVGAGGPITIELRDINANNATIATATANVPGGGSTASPIPLTVPLNFTIPAGDYRLLKTSATGPPMAYTLAGATNYPYPIGTSGQITSGSTATGTATTYYYFFNWTIGSGVVLCESPREEVIATVDQTGDKLVGPLDYTDTDNTVNYGNSFSGTPGCGFNGNYLDGNAVVYRYSPATDDIVNIELTNVTNNSAGVFVYQSCGDVGTNCLAGAVNSGGVYLIPDFYATGGQDYFIVVTSETGSTGYTLNIYGFDCATDLDAPTGDATQYFVGTKDLTDLAVDEYEHSTGLTWYSDAAGTLGIPDTTPLIHNTTYYVAQTVLGCESDLLAITALEFDCSDLEVISTTGAVVCNSGSMTLSAQGGGIGNEIYWYDAQSNGNLVGVGSTYETPVLTSTRSYWAEEIYLEGGIGAAGSVGPLNPSSVGPGGGTSAAITTYHIEFDVLQQTKLLSVDIFPTAAVGSSSSIEIRDSAGATIINVPYTTTVTGGATAQTIPLNVTLTPGTGYRMGQVSPIALFRNTSGATYPYTSPFINIISNNFNPAYHYYFYNWQYGGGTVLCNSNRTEVIAEVNKNLPSAPVAAPTQEFCGLGNTVADLVAIGDNIKWYDANGALLSGNAAIVDGESYFATQTIQACEGPSTEVAVVILDKSTTPVADQNQTFFNGETLADLDVIGTDLLWYADLDRMVPLPDTTLLVDQTTYYVSQTEAGFCESDLFAITVHRLIGVNDPAFDNVLVLPNPASDRLTISNNGPIGAVELYNLLGQRVAAQNAGMQREMVMDVSFLSSGTYLLNVKIDGKTGIFKVIKE